jgi:phospholipase C
MPTNQLSSINHIVVLMLENRSFDHMLGLLYSASGNVSAASQPFEGLTGKESNPSTDGSAVSVFTIAPTDPNAYFMPGADPGEGYTATNSQLFGSTTAPAPPVATNNGFVTDFSYTLGWESKEGGSIIAGTAANSIMGVFPPTMLPVLSGLARGFAVCDYWFGSVPTETLPNRAFVNAGTSQGHMDDKTTKYTCPSIFGLLSSNKVTWSIYGYDTPPLTRPDFTDTTNADDSHFGEFTDFQTAAGNGTLPAYAFLEPSFDASGNSQHPNYDVALGEQLIHDASILKTIETRWNLPALTARDAAASAVGDVLTLTQPRTDDPLQGVTAPVATGLNPDEDRPSHLQEVQAEMVSQLPVPDEEGGTHHTMPRLTTNSDYKAYICARTAAWRASRQRSASPAHA